MPSLPVDNQRLNSKKDAYRRYFGSLKEYSPERPKILLFWCLLYICGLSTILSIFKTTFLYIYYRHISIYRDDKLYYVANLTQMIVTCFWCWAIILVIFYNKENYSNLKSMFFVAFIISFISFILLSVLSYLNYDSNVSVDLHINSYFDSTLWNVYVIYFYTINFPLTLYLSIIIMHFKTKYIYRAISVQTNDGVITPHYIELRDNKNDILEVFEKGNDDTYGTEYIYDNNTPPPHKKKTSLRSISFDTFEKSTKTLICNSIFVYCIILILTLFSWFIINTIASDVYDNYYIIMYIILFTIYNVAKYVLKRVGRKIDKQMVVPNFSFEIITEILLSSFYWFNLRIFPLRYPFHIYWASISVFIIHLSMEIFQNSIRISSGYFNMTSKKNINTKSNITQWKVRGAIDTIIRFIIIIYSIVFVSIRYAIGSYSELQHNKLIESVIFTYILFIIECIYFSIILFIPGCSGKISAQQQINVAEPLMRIYSSNKLIFITVFSGTMVMSQLLVF